MTETIEDKTKGHYSINDKYQGNCYMCTGVDDRCVGEFSKQEILTKIEKPSDLVCYWKSSALEELKNYAIHKDINKVKLTYRFMIKEFIK